MTFGRRVKAWVKQGIMLGFEFGDFVDASMDHGNLPLYDKDTLSLATPVIGKYRDSRTDTRTELQAWIR